MSVDPVYAYCGQRAVDRKTVKGVTRHALSSWARLSGAMDAECGAIGVVELGLWDAQAFDPVTAPACEKCTAVLAGQITVPEEAAALRQPAPAKRSGTPSLFAAA